MYSTAIAVVTSIILIAGADTTCTKRQDDVSHLVQSLQDCANAIAGLPSSDIPQHCSRDGLQQKIENVSLLLEKVIADQEIRLKNITNNITAIKDSTAEAIKANQVNQEILLANISQRINANRASITTNKGNIAANKADIATNQANAATNAANIATISNTILKCGSAGWTQIAYLNMSNPSAQCPHEFSQSSEVRGCRRKSSPGGSCNAKRFCPNGASYSEVCGRVVGYQYGSPDAIDHTTGIGSNQDPEHGNIDSHYVDGVSITHGSPRMHIWTLMVGVSEVGSHQYACPCNTGSTTDVKSFIGNDYFCESGNTVAGWEPKVYTEDLLWDGKKCRGQEGPCCDVPGLPWFHKVLSSPTTDDIELRICGDQNPSDDENVFVSQYEIYVK